MNSKKSSKNSQTIDETLQMTVNDTLQKFIDEKLKQSIETFIVETLNTYTEEQKKYNVLITQIPTRS